MIALIPWLEFGSWNPIGGIHVRPFGVLVCLGIGCGVAVALARARRVGVDARLVREFLAYVLLAGLASSYVLNPPLYDWEGFLAVLRRPSAFFERYRGLSSYGGFAGGLAAALAFARRRHASILVLGDVFCYAFPFAWMLCRTGCFTAHDHPGTPSSFVLAVDDYARSGVSRHDLGLYEVLWSVVAAALVLRLGRARRRAGTFLVVVPGFYAAMRFWLDFLRAGPHEGGDVRYLGWTPAQYASVATLFAVLAVAVRVRRAPAVSHRHAARL